MKWFKFLIAFLVPIAGVMVCNNALDNDSWYVLAEGREIVENGIYYEDQLSMHEGLEVTVQNYGFAAIFYLVYQAFGPVGIYVGMLILNLILCYLIYKICMLLSNKNINLSLLIMILTDLLLARWFVVTRAQMLSYIIMMLLIYLLELYVKKGKTKLLWWVPILSLIQINLHASLWPIILIVLVIYLMGKGYKKTPLIATLALSCLAGFLNPYGFRMMTFILTSYGVSEANKAIIELQAFNLDGNFNILLYMAIAGAMIFYIYGRRQRIRFRWLILIFGFLALGLNTVKGMSHLILVLLFPLAAVYKNISMERWGNRKIRWMAGSWAGVMAVTLIITIMVVRIPQVIDGPNEDMISAVDILDKENVDKENAKIYSGFDDGGYLEYRGYKAYMDPRMEVFIKANNGKEDIFKEWYNLRNGDIKKRDFLDKYEFDYLVTIESEKLYEPENDKYEMIFEVNDEDREGVRVWKKV